MYLTSRAGSELYTRDLAINLNKRGHNVTVYSPFLGKIAKEIQLAGIRVIDNLNSIQREHFDVIHSHHNIPTIQARTYFPNTPIVRVVHGIIPFLEQPASISPGSSFYVAISEEVKKHLLDKGISGDKIKIIRNWIDISKFIYKAPAKQLKNILVLSNHFTFENEKILKQAVSKLQVTYAHVGLPENSLADAHKAILKSDLVITIGRGVLEAVSCGKNVLIWDIHGADGMLTKDNFHQLRQHNFSGRTNKLHYTVPGLVREIKKYSPHNGTELRKLIEKEHTDAVVLELEKLYCKSLQTKVNGPLKRHDLISENDYLLKEINQSAAYILEEEQKIREITMQRDVLYPDYTYFQDFKKCLLWKTLELYRRLKSALRIKFAISKKRNDVKRFFVKNRKTIRT